MKTVSKTLILLYSLLFILPGLVFGQGDAQAHLNRGFALYQQGQFQQALVEFEEGVKLSPGRADGYRLIGLSYLQLKNYDQAITALKKAVELATAQQQEDEAAKIALGRAYYQKQQYAEALPLIDYAAKRQNKADDYVLLGDLHLRLNNFQAARQAVEKATALAPTNTLALDLMLRLQLQNATTTRDAASFAQAVKVGRQLKAVRDDAATAVLLGQAHLGAKQYKEAVQELKKAAEALPSDGAVQFQYGQALALTEQWLLAQMALERAAQHLSDNPAVYNLLGYAYEAEGARVQDEQTRASKFTEALEAYEKADQLLKGADAGIKASIERVKPFAKKQ